MTNITQKIYKVGYFKNTMKREKKVAWLGVCSKTIDFNSSSFLLNRDVTIK